MKLVDLREGGMEGDGDGEGWRDGRGKGGGGGQIEREGERGWEMEGGKRTDRGRNRQ